jgi:hypothetical protein
MKTEQTFKVGDKATFTTYSDSKAGYITEVSKSGKTVTFQVGDAKLLNGFDSGESDALEFTAGGFCGHVSGDQRWEITPNPANYTIKCTYRNRPSGNGVWKSVGHPTNSMGCVLGAGHFHHYDYNF